MPERFGAAPAPSEEDLELNRPAGSPGPDAGDLHIRVEDDSSRIPINRVGRKSGVLNIDSAGEDSEPSPKKGAGVFGRVKNLLRRSAAPAAEPGPVSETFEETMESPLEPDLRPAPVRRSAAEWMKMDEMTAAPAETRPPLNLADLDEKVEMGIPPAPVSPPEVNIREPQEPPLPVPSEAPPPPPARRYRSGVTIRIPRFGRNRAPEEPAGESEAEPSALLSAEGSPAPEKPPTPEEIRVAEARSKFAEQNKRFLKVCKPLSKKEEAVLANVPADLRPEAGDDARIKSQDPEESRPVIQRQQQYVSFLTSQGFSWDRAFELAHLASSKADYDAAKVAWGRSMETAAYSDLEAKFGPEDSWTAEQMDEADRLVKERRAEIARTLIFGEAARLQAENVEGYPPREKGIMRKAYEGYMRLPRTVRIAGTSLLISGLALPFASTSAALFTGGRLVRSLAAATLAQGVGKGIDKLSDRIIKDRREKGMTEILDNFTLEKLAEGEKANEALVRDLAWDEKKKLIVKGVLMLGAGISTAAALTSIFEGMGVDLRLDTGGGRAAETAGTRPRAAGASEQASRPAVQRPGPAPERTSPAAAAEPAPRTAPPSAQVPPTPDQTGAPSAGGADAPERPAPPAQSAAERTGESQETTGGQSIEELATVGKGKGIWHAVYRQLEAQLGQHSPDRFGLSPEDLEDPAKVREVLVRETARILEKKNFVTPDGTEIEVPAGDELWIKSPGAKAFLGPDDQITIEGETSLRSMHVRPAQEDMPASPQAPGAPVSAIPNADTQEPVVPAGPPEDQIRRGVPPAFSVPEPTHPPTPENLGQPAPAEVASTPRPGGAGTLEANNPVGDKVASILEGRVPAQGNNPVGENVASILEGRGPVRGRNAVGNLLESILGGPDPRLGGLDVTERPYVPPAPESLPPRLVVPETPVRTSPPETPRVVAAEVQATPRPEVRPSLDATLPKSYVEAVPNRDAFPRVLDHQLKTHLGEKFTSLPEAVRQNAGKFIEMQARANPGLLGNLDRLSGRSLLDFSRLFEDKVLLEKAISFGEETRYLGILGFKPAEYLNPEYAFVVRETPVAEYLAHFPQDLGQAMDRNETFAIGDKKVQVKLAFGHIRLADILRQFPIDDRTKGMTPFEFLRHHGAVK